jgi:hypothetical protein
MRKRHLVVGGVVVLVGVVSYGFAQMMAASPGAESATAQVAEGMSSTATDAVAMMPLLPVGALELVDTLGPVSDPTLMFAAGAMLIAVAAGVRRHTC